MNDRIDEPNPALAAVQAAWNAGARCWDSQALTDVYTADARVFGMRPSHSQEAEAIREHFAAYDGVIESASLELSRRQVVRLAADSLFAQGIGHFSFATGGGPASRARLRTMLVIVLHQGRWRIRQHHFLTHADRIAAMPAQNL